MALSSPNAIVFEYFDVLRNLVNSAKESADKKHVRQLVFLSIVTAISLVETFLNMYVQVRAQEEDRQELLGLYNQHMHVRKSLEFKLKNWPKKFFNVSLDFTTGPGGQFDALKSKRNALMHFKSSYQTIELDGIQINGLADTSIYDELTAKDAESAMTVTISFIAYFFESIGVEKNQVPHMLHGWTGKIPI